MNKNLPNLLIGSAIFIGLIFILFTIFKSIVSILQWIAPILLIVTLIMDRSVVFDYVKMIGNKLKNETMLGIGLVVVTVLGFPFVSAYLFFKAFLRRKVKQMEKKNDPYGGAYVEYEELDEPLELPKLEKPQKETSGSQSEYGKYFE